MTSTRHGSAVIEFPSDLEILITREFHAPIQLVFDVLTKAEHARNTIAPFGEEVTECSFDTRVGGNYHYTFVTGDGRAMTFYGTFLEVQPPTRIVDTWQYDGWPDVKAVETVDLHEANGVTTLTWRLAFSARADARSRPNGFSRITRPPAEQPERARPDATTPNRLGGIAR